MALQRSIVAFQTIRNLRKINGEIKLHLRSRTTTASGAILPEPKRTRFGFFFVICCVSTGLVIGTTLSKMVANFLEEKELFVPSDDDDDDD